MLSQIQAKRREIDAAMEHNKEKMAELGMYKDFVDKTQEKIANYLFPDFDEPKYDPEYKEFVSSDKIEHKLSEFVPFLTPSAQDSEMEFPTYIDDSYQLECLRQIE